MGTSKVIMLSGVYLMLGFYNVSFYQADRSNSTSVIAAANSVQAELLARTGISLAMAKMGSNSSLKSFSSEESPVNGGTVTIQAVSVSSSTSQITSTAVFNGRTLTMTALFNYDRGRWRMIASYVTPTAEVVS